MKRNNLWTMPMNNLVDFANSIIDHFYLEDGELDSDKEVNGGDLVDHVSQMLQKYELVDLNDEITVEEPAIPTDPSAQWLKEFDADFAVPAEILNLVSKGLAEDLSWHNDTSPKFGVEFDDRQNTKRYIQVLLWSDHPDPEQRELGGHRFTVCEGDFDIEDGIEEVVSTDDVAEAVSCYLSRVQRQVANEVVRWVNDHGMLHIMEKLKKDQSFLDDFCDANAVILEAFQKFDLFHHVDPKNEDLMTMFREAWDAIHLAADDWLGEYEQKSKEN